MVRSTVMSGVGVVLRGVLSALATVGPYAWAPQRHRPWSALRAIHDDIAGSIAGTVAGVAARIASGVTVNSARFLSALKRMEPVG